MTGETTTSSLGSQTFAIGEFTGSFQSVKWSPKRDEYLLKNSAGRICDAKYINETRELTVEIIWDSGSLTRPTIGNDYPVTDSRFGYRTGSYKLVDLSDETSNGGFNRGTATLKQFEYMR